ncbi:MAG: InlB B-repeat-containing protein, partial [Paludibacteraceae bacterium]
MKNNILKSILATILLLLGVSHAAWADAGFWDNGGVVLTFRVDGTTKEVSLNNNVTTQDFGSLSSLSLNQVLCNVWKDGSGNICSATAYYKIDEGSYSSGFATIYSSSNGNNQVWKGTFDANLLNGVSVGAHKLTLYFMATGSTSSSSDCSQNIYYSNNSQNYVFTFTYCTTPTIAWGTAPADGTVGGNMTATVSTNQTSPTVTWTSSNTSVATVDANGKITYVAAGTTTITASYTGDGTTYCAETVSVSKDITVTAAATALNIYVQGRFKVRTSEGGSEWKYTGSADDDSWNTSSTNIKFEYEEATGYYKLNTYCSVKELSASINNTNYYYFHFKEGSTEYGATDDNIKPALEANKRTIQSGDKNFIFTTSDCEKGDNVVLYLDWSNKTFWYAVDPTYTVTYDYNGGSGSETSATCKQGEAVTLPTPNTREGYTFNGWYTAATDGTLAGAAGATYTPTGDITLYAQWLKDYSADTYYYYDEKGDWQDTVCKALTKLTEYSFVELENSYILDRDGNKNKFKIFDKNTKRKDNWNTETEATHLVANGDNIAEKLADENLRNQLKGNIKLTNTGDNFNNAQYDTMSINEASFFVVLYYPNTSLNSSNNFVLAAMTTLPDAEKYNVTFGVVDNVGGTLTAKSSDGSTISSGALVSYATFTATPDAGYAVEGWYSDAEGTQRIDAAGTSTTYSQAITEANNSVYVKFAQVRAVYFKNNHNWSEVHIYTFSNDPFNSDYNDKDNNTQDETHKKGIGPAGALEKAQMTHIGDDIYMYQLTKANKFKYIAFTSKNQYGYDNFYDYNDVVSRTDHNDTTGLFMYIPDKSESANTVNKNGDNHANYFYKGVWMKPNSTDAGYELVIHTSSVNDHKYAYFKAPTAGGFEFSYETVLTGGVTYSFFVKNDNNNYFGRGSDAGNTTISSTTNDLEMYLWGSGDVGEVSFTPVISGTYTFTLHLQDGRVLIDVIYPTTQYRLVYVEKDGSTIKKFHPSHIIKQRAGGTAEAPLYDTVSMHVRPYIRTWKEDTQKYDTTQNNTSMVWLQEFKKADENSNSMDWVTIKTIDTQKQKNITTNGVYNFVIKQDGSSATIDTTKTYPYTGRYYVRTDASDGGWNNYKQLSNYCYYNEYSRVYRGFDHYYCHWTTANTNIKYTIACDYSYCVSDTLAKEDHTPHNDFTDENDKFKYNA